MKMNKVNKKKGELLKRKDQNQTLAAIPLKVQTPVLKMKMMMKVQIAAEPKL